MKRQVIALRGGETHDSYKEYVADLKKQELDLERFGEDDWKDTLHKALGNGFDVILPQMPNKKNAKYLEWEIWFDKIVRHLKPGVALIGHSLGGIFLAKYLSQHRLPKKIGGVFLVSAPYDTKDMGGTLVDFVLPKSLKKLSDQAENIFIYHSSDDPIVPFADFGKYMKALPSARGFRFKDRKHMNMRSFPELVAHIKNL